MYYTTRDVVDAIITAGARRGSDGRGKDGLDGRMFMLARTDRASFGSLLAAALRLKMKAKPERWAARKESLTDEEIKAEFRERGLPEELFQYLPKYDPNNPPAALRKYAQPNGTRELMEAIINAAIRHGSDGHGKDGLVGYMLVLERTKFKTFVRLMELAQQWQVKATAPSDKPRRSLEEIEARIRASGMDYDAIDAIFEKRLAEGPLHDGEDPDPWGLNRPETIDVPPDDH
jgi:hypothetical protein